MAKWIPLTPVFEDEVDGVEQRAEEGTGKHQAANAVECTGHFNTTEGGNSVRCPGTFREQQSHTSDYQDHYTQGQGQVQQAPYWAEAAYVLKYLLPPGLLDAIHVYFPDPWPKKRHHKNRLISEPFPPLAKRLLREGGIVYLRTDNIEYFEQMLEVFGDAVGFETVETPEPMKQLVTDFEQQFNAQGIPTNYAAYRSVGE